MCSSFLQTEILLLGGRREVRKTQKANGIDKDRGTQKVTGFAGPSPESWKPSVAQPPELWKSVPEASLMLGGPFGDETTLEFPLTCALGSNSNTLDWSGSFCFHLSSVTYLWQRDA